MKDHTLKCWTEFFEAIQDGRKTFEIRKNDRGFQVDDLLILQEWEPLIPDPQCPRHQYNLADESCTCGSRGRYTGRIFYAAVTYITDFAQDEGFIVMAIKPMGDNSP